MNIIQQFFNSIAEEYDNGAKKDFCLIDSLLDEIGIRKGDSVLDLGCGKGVISERLYERSLETVIAMDLSDKMIHFALEKGIPDSKVTFVNEDFYLTKRKGFDKIVLFDSYPHFLDLGKFKRKSLEVLSKDGILAIVHDISRDYLSKVHQGISPISRNLLPVNEEASLYLDSFDIIKAEETENSYLLTMKKKIK